MESRLLRHIPSIDRWLNTDAGIRLCAQYDRVQVAQALRDELSAVRQRLTFAESAAAPAIDAPATGAALPDFDSDAFEKSLRTRLAARERSGLHPLINATGIILHTNLGRAPLCDAAIAAIDAHAGRYTNLEFDLNTGKRGSRQQHAAELLRQITAAEDALIVNNCAAAVVLVLAKFCRNREVVISRGELIEIGGSFRMPDVIAESGAIMREVGTTNRTSLDDYSRAITPETRILLSSHPSNYRVVGFSASPTPEEIAELARARDCLSVLDLGSGCLVDLSRAGVHDEPTVQQCVRAGIDLITVSGDKLLGGPQAGIVLGRADLIAELRGSPLARAMRIDKLSLTALVETLRQYLPPHDPFVSIPVLRMLSESAATLQSRSEQVAAAVRQAAGAHASADIDVVTTSGYAGGGTLPVHELPGRAVRVRTPGGAIGDVAERLRHGTPPVVGRIRDDALWLDLRTVAPDQESQLIDRLTAALE